MKLYKPLEDRIEASRPAYKRVSDAVIKTVKKGSKNPYVRAGAVLGAAALATMVLSPDTAYAAKDIAQQTIGKYGVISGVIDGFLAPLNLIMSAFGENASTWARDGTGIASEPASFWYNLGYYLIISGEGSAIFSSTKKKSEDKPDHYTD